MDYRYLKAFKLVAQHMSFSRAAETLSIAQSAVSRQIKLLEEGLGQELIIRSSKKVLLTHKGRELYQATRYFDERTSEIFEREDNRRLNIGILHGLLKNWFTPKVVKFYESYNRDIHIDVKDEPELIKGIEAGELDIIFTTQNIQSDLVSSLKIFDEHLVLISKNKIDLGKLEDERWIVFSEGDNIFKISKTHSKSIVSVESITTILDLVEQGVGIAVVPDHVLSKNNDLEIYELPSAEKSEIYMTTLNFKMMPSYIKEVLELIK